MPDVDACRRQNSSSTQVRAGHPADEAPRNPRFGGGCASLVHPSRSAAPNQARPAAMDVHALYQLRGRTPARRNGRPAGKQQRISVKSAKKQNSSAETVKTATPAFPDRPQRQVRRTMLPRGMRTPRRPAGRPTTRYRSGLNLVAPGGSGEPRHYFCRGSAFGAPCGGGSAPLSGSGSFGGSSGGADGPATTSKS